MSTSKLAQEAAEYAAREIQKLIENPPQRRQAVDGQRYPETDAAKAIGAKAVQQIREVACKATGMTMDELIAAEESISYPRAIIDPRTVPGVMAKSRMKGAGVPDLFVRHVAEREPVECEAMRYVRQYLGSTKGFLMLSGGKGTMKTGSAAWALGQIDGGMFLDAMALTRLSIDRRDEWEKYLRAPLVVLDDLGTEKRDRQGAYMAAFYELFNGAYSGCRRIIMTGNITKAEFKAPPEDGGFGERVADRFREQGDWYTVSGQSVRGQ